MNLDVGVEAYSRSKLVYEAIKLKNKAYLFCNLMQLFFVNYIAISWQ